MKFECKTDPNILINGIGNRFFSICDDDYGDGLYKHDNHPNVVRLIDCEAGVEIDVWSEHGPEETMKTAVSLLELLNQDYNETF